MSMRSLLHSDIRNLCLPFSSVSLAKGFHFIGLFKVPTLSFIDFLYFFPIYNFIDFCSTFYYLFSSLFFGFYLLFFLQFPNLEA